MYCITTKSNHSMRMKHITRICLLALLLVTCAAGAWALEPVTVTYIDNNGVMQTRDNVIPLLRGPELSGLAPGWYVVADNIIPFGGVPLTLSSSSDNSGDIHLIIPTGLTVNLTQQATPVQISSGGLHIYAMDDADEPGKLIVNCTAFGDALQVDGDLEINGCSIEIAADQLGKGIACGGSITVNGGSVTVTSPEFAIFAENTLTINGGSVTASGGYTGILCGNGLFFNGGQLSATGNETTGIGCGATLKWTSADDSFTVNGPDEFTTFTITEGFSFIDDVGNIYSDNSSTHVIPSGTTLRPYIDISGDAYAEGADVTALLGARLVSGTTDEWEFFMPEFDVLAEVEFFDPTVKGYCGVSYVNDGKNLCWTLTDEDGDSTPETLTISPNPDCDPESDLRMANYDWDSNLGTVADRPWNDYAADITSVVIADGVQSVGGYSFSHLPQLKSFSLGSDVAVIEDYAFSSCTSLTSLAIPETLNSIRGKAFSYCTNLAEVTVGTNLKIVGEYAFEGTAWLADQTDNAMVYLGPVAYVFKGDTEGTVSIISGTYSISNFAFDGKSISGIVLPEGLDLIGTAAFQGCQNLTSVTIPSTVSLIEPMAFFACDHLTSVTLLPVSPPNLPDFESTFANCFDAPVPNQHFYVDNDAYMESSSDWYKMWEYMASSGWQKEGEDNVSTEVAIAKGVSTRCVLLSLAGETTEYFTFREALEAAKAVPSSADVNDDMDIQAVITLLDDVYLDEDVYDISLGDNPFPLSLDLNGHTMSIPHANSFVFSGNNDFHIFDGQSDGAPGSIVCTTSEVTDGALITVNGASLYATNITIDGGLAVGIRNSSGRVDIVDSYVTGYDGIINSGSLDIYDSSVSGARRAVSTVDDPDDPSSSSYFYDCTISGGDYGIYSPGGSLIGFYSDVYIEGYSVAGIYTEANSNLFYTLPTFTKAENSSATDIMLASNHVLDFDGSSYEVPVEPITIGYITDEAGGLSDADLPKSFTSGYSDYVTDGDGVIDPAQVFAYADADRFIGVGLSDDGEATFYAPHTFTFRDHQEWMTWCDSREWCLPSGIAVYDITAVDDNGITVEPREDDIIPAYQPVLLKKVDDEGFTAKLFGSPAAPASGYDEDLGLATSDLSTALFLGATKAITPSGMNSAYVFGKTYVLSNGAFILADTNAGLAANKCCLTLTGSSQARVLTLGASATGVTSIESAADGDGRWYTLDGRQMDKKPAQKGIYIYNGKKHIVK